MTQRVPHLPFSLDPLIAEAKRRARRRSLLLALGVVAIGAVAVTVALRPGSGPQSRTEAGGAGSAAENDGPVLAGGVAPVSGGEVVATMIPRSAKVGQVVKLIQLGTAPIDSSGNFLLRPNPTSPPLARAIADAITHNGGWVNLDLNETGTDGRSALTSISRQSVDASGTPLSLAEFREAPGKGQWIGDGTGSTTVDPKYEFTLPRSRGSHR
jgi:hypothetical protein